MPRGMGAQDAGQTGARLDNPGRIMPALKYWPYPVTGFVALVMGGVIAVAFLAMRHRGAVLHQWPVVASGLLLLVGAGVIVAHSHRPGFLKAPAPVSTHSIEGFESYMELLMAEGDPPGASVVVVKDGKVVYAKGFGDADGPRNVPARPDTAYRWWSVTKVFTAVAIMQLAERGALDLDDPVQLHVPEFEVSQTPATTGTITVRHLLTHSSGLPDAGLEILGWIHYEGEPHRDQTELLLEKLPSHARLKAAPGEEGRYTNIGYMVLAAVIEAVSGEPYEDYIEAHILEPLGMDHTGFVYPQDAPGGESVASHPVDLMAVPASVVVDLNSAVRERAEGRLWFHRVYPDQTSPSGLIGTPTDMARFVAAMLAGGELDGHRILSTASAEAMGVRHVDVSFSPAPNPGAGFGLGWFDVSVDGRASLAHGGQGMGTASLVQVYPDEDLGIIVVANGTYFGRNFGMDAVGLLASIPWEVGPHLD